jgi:serine/threonine protein kinase
LDSRAVKKPTPFGKYYLLEKINTGGMAEVFRAKAFGVEGFERLVAVKRILPNIAEDKEFIRMFIDEAKLAVQLNHANIAQIFDLGVVDASYYIALEHVHGRDLRAMFDRCRNAGEPMPVSQACFIIMKVCEGLDYAHNKRDQAGRELHLVHRDVSPQNVLVSFEGEVKLIDFGIAKAAGKGSKTQAGILKGKFGYMSPEQVRGIPIDRRSDVFSCGIVLYELLTGERLFVGESDFSTLEKVRNVEILPPSTYNRRIPDELERIVLKALAKDPEERYQNAIDLHDELQAFVYTAGEFYSRKDLAAWMKKTFGREIEEETAKLESYRQLKAPASEAPPPPAIARTPTGQRPPSGPVTTPVRKTNPPASAVGGTKPPPPPAGRLSQQMPVVQAAAPAKPKPERVGEGLSWDDDELETQIYDNPEDAPKSKKKSGASPVVAAPAPQPAPPPPPSPGPDLSSLVSTAKGWDGAPRPTPPTNGTNGMAAIAAGSQKTLRSTGEHARTTGEHVAEPVFPVVARETSAPARLVSSSPEPLFDPMASFGSGMLARKPKRQSSNLVYIAVGGAAVAVVAAVVIITMTGKKPSTKTAAAVPAPTQVAGDQNTGFDLYVNPPGVVTWRLDGEARTDKLPSRIRGISPGAHNVAIDAPPGFMSQNQPITVEAGKAPKIEIVLQPLDISGVFETTPPGATVSLIVDGVRQPVGSSPAKAKLDPRKSYQVLFEKPGYVSVNKPIIFGGSTEEKLVVNLEKAGAGTPEAPPNPPTTTHVATGPVTHPETHVATTRPDTTKPDTTKPDTTKPDTTKPDTTKPDTQVAKTGGIGTLLLGSKPPCQVFIDGKDTGSSTPHKFDGLAAGRHKVTLVNNEFGIKETFSVDVKADGVEKQIKDYSDRLPK